MGVCLIGWSQVDRFEGEPLAAWTEALRRTDVPAERIDSLDVVYCQSWPYDDPPGRLAEAVGATPARTHYSGIGGTTPLQLLIAAARRIEAGRSSVSAIVGGEALATLRRIKRAGERPTWSHRHPEKQAFPFEAPFHPAELAHQVFQATTTFALRDVARRAHLGTAPADYRAGLGALFAPMTSVAAANPHAWFPVERTPTELVQAGPANRMVAYPYTKLLVSILDVDLAGAVVVASTEAADALGVPEERRVHLRGWGEARDPDYVAEHPELWRSPGMAHALHGALLDADTSFDELDLIDLYSCFPAAVHFALDALGADRQHPLAPFTVTGGLPYAGGAGSNYALSSLAAMADRVTEGPGATGMVTAVGMHLSKHAAVVLGTEPADGPPAGAELFEPSRRPIVDTFDGRATVAAYTVHHDRDDLPTEALLVCDLHGIEGTRGYAVARDPELLATLEAEEWVGREVEVATLDGGVNLAVAP